jgi:hypothetical protein
MLLPGYITLILGIVLFHPGFLLNTSTNSPLPFNVFSIILFIVAGPAIGFILWQIYFHMTSLLMFSRHTFNIKYEFQRAYTQLRLVCKSEQRQELDSLDGRHIFGFSAAVGLGVISLFTLVILFIAPSSCKFFNDSILCRNHTQGVFIFALIVAVVIVLAVGSYFDNKRSRLVIICKLIEEYKKSGDLEIDMPSTCKRRFRKLEQRDRQVACSIIYNYFQDEKLKDKTGGVSETDVQNRLIGSDLFHGNKTDASGMIEEMIEEGVLDLLEERIDWKKLKEMETPQLGNRLIRSITMRWPFKNFLRRARK